MHTRPYSPCQRYIHYHLENAIHLFKNTCSVVDLCQQRHEKGNYQEKTLKSKATMQGKLLSHYFYVRGLSLRF